MSRASARHRSPDKPRRSRLAIISSHPIQYQAPLFRRLEARGVLELDVFFLSTHGLTPSFDPGFGRDVNFDVPLLEGYRHFFLPNLSRGFPVGHPLSVINPRLVTALRTGTYDAVLVHGYATVSMWLALATARLSGIPFILRGESRADTDVRLPAWKAIAKRALIGRLVKTAAACAAIGKRNSEFYLQYGAEPSRVVLAPYSVDVERFAQAGRRGRESRSARLRTLGLTQDRPVILFAAKLQHWKRPLDLLAAFQLMSVPANLLFVGDGPLRGELETRMNRFPSGRVLGFMNQQELGELYGMADVFVLPSEKEPWGLAVNEALAAGTPVVVSDQVGCAPDLITPSTGAVVPVADPNALARALDALCGNPRRLHQMRPSASAIASKYSLDATAAGIEQAASTATVGLRA